jgi:serine protease
MMIFNKLLLLLLLLGDLSCGILVACGFLFAAGVAGLVWSAHTECTASEIRAAISASARDLGIEGRDNHYGHGLVQAMAAHQYLIANRCSAKPTPGSGDPPPPPSPDMR